MSEVRSLETAVEMAVEKFGLPMNGYLKEYQKKAVIDLMEGKDVFIAQPTGAGKSMVYQLLPLAFDIFLHGRVEDDGEMFDIQSTVIVVSPLTSLIQDQMKTFTSKKLRCISLSNDATEKQCSEALNGGFAFIFTSPEAVVNKLRVLIRKDEEFQSRLRAVVVDESHCVVKW